MGTIRNKIHLIRQGYLRPIIAFTVQNRVLKHKSCPFISTTLCRRLHILYFFPSYISTSIFDNLDEKSSELNIFPVAFAWAHDGCCLYTKYSGIMCSGVIKMYFNTILWTWPFWYINHNMCSVVKIMIHTCSRRYTYNTQFKVSKVLREMSRDNEIIIFFNEWAWYSGK